MKTGLSAPAVIPGAHASPQALFFCGALLFPPFLMQQDLVVRTGLMLLFIALNMLAGKRVRLLQLLVVAAGIVLFNLVIPTGRVLAAPLGLAITEGAMKSGIMKATAMTGLMVLSQFSVRPSLRLPGRFGGMTGRSFFCFEAIMNERQKIDRKDIIGSIDALLLSVRAAGEPREDTNPAPPTAAIQPFPNAGGLATLTLLVLGHWAVFVLTLFHPRPFWSG
jgi:heptaprenyl diphosphate synthase